VYIISTLLKMYGDRQFTVNSGAVLSFRALHLIRTLYIQDYQMHNNVPRNLIFFLVMSVTNGRLKAVRHSLIITWENVSNIFASVLKKNYDSTA